VLNKSCGIATIGLARKGYRNMFFLLFHKRFNAMGLMQHCGKGDLKWKKKKLLKLGQRAK
jgi:hypothetical protein